MTLSTVNFGKYTNEQLSKEIKELQTLFKLKKSIVLFKMDKVSSENKLQLRRAIAKDPQSMFLLCSFNPKVLAFSTGAKVFHAINLLNWKHSLVGLKYRFRLMTEIGEATIPVYYEGQTLNIKHSDICCIKGSGNYCYFYVSGRQELLITIRMKEVKAQLKSSDFFLDVNRSLLVNVNRIASIGKEFITFQSQPRYKLNLGYRSLKKVRDEVMWNT